MVTGYDTGLTGSVSVGVYDNGQTIIPRTTSGISEIEETGTYVATIMAPSPGTFQIIWDDGSGNAAIEDLEVSESPSGAFLSSPTTAALAAVMPVWSLSIDGRRMPDFINPSGVEGDPDYEPGTTGMTQTEALTLLAEAENEVVGRIGPLNDKWDAQSIEVVRTLILHRAVYLGAMARLATDPSMVEIADRFLALSREDLAAAQSAVARWDEQNGITDLTIVPVGRFSTGIHGYDPLAPTFEQGMLPINAHQPFAGARSSYWILGPEGIPILVTPGGG